ncbi:gliding motility protein [Flavobacterium sp. SOK18b]|uniref:T9SS type B sorting domain-containing protein n=1 Tax=Flavobacterium sp. SOK18b TaxID=797900 RepID=UPI0015FC5BEB|nr:T9SS type B sorting domain-containing protein [Flavobacterium sp. SOK18b]MBB1193537.1 gliding motility protein [Flavobacterium sp. SOK18b]
MKKTLLLLTILLSISCFAQFSKTHYIPPITAQSNVVEDHYIYISTPNSKDVPFKIIENGGNVITGVVNNITPFRYFIGTGDFTQLFTPKNTIGILKNKGYVIEAEDLVYANIRVNAARTNSGAYNHAGGLVSKGNSALGKTFRLGAMLNPLFDTTLLNFASILATENGTKVTISNLPIGTVLTDGTVISGPITLTLNKNESYVLALENTNSGATPSNSAKMIGALVESDKAVVINAGSFCGSNSSTPTGRDVGFDQIVPIERTGTEYIFAKGLGTDELERVLLVAHTDQTKVYLNGNTSPFTTLNKGEYVAIDGANFTNGSLYVTSSEKVFAYQSIGGTASPANQNMFFVPPLNCSTPNVVDNIPNIQEIGSTFYDGGLNIITETGATVLINNSPISASPQSIIGNPGFVKYTVSGLSGNIAVKSTKQVYVSYFATNGAATYGGYYSGFDIKPEIVSDKIAVGTSSCIPNVVLKISSLSAYDTFQWYKDDVAIPLATTNSYTPTTPGYYQVKGSISGCLSDVFSDKIPVSDCAKDNDNDGTNNNIDIDWDNDGLLNTVESSSNFFNHSNALSASNFNATVTGSGTITGYPVYGFVSDVPAGKNNPTIYKITFTKPETIDFRYITDGNAQTTPSNDFANGDGDFVVSAPTNQTLTIMDPFGDLLIDTNYDGIYESGVKEFTSFEIRFRFKSTTAVTQGTARFTILGYKVDSLTFKHYNLSDLVANRAAFYIGQTIDQDTDLDTIPDALDIDSDNDGIPDTIEAQGKGFKSFSGVDTNKDGLDNAFEPGLVAINSDSDINGTGYLVKDILDLDSDNDGIYDLVEAGHNTTDANKDGKVDGIVGINGLLDSLETAPDSGKLKYTIADTDADGNFNYFELDSDDDGCKDVIEAGFLDGDADGLLGNSPVTVNDKGVVTSGTGYTTPNVNYTIGAPIVITKQPSNTAVCQLENASFTIDAVAISTYQWEQTIDGTNWTTLTNNTNYSGVNTATLTVNNVTNSMNNYKYRVFLNRNGNSCGLYSATANLSINALPVITNSITLVQCDDDTDGSSTFNLTQKNNQISTNAVNEVFTYYTNAIAATSENNTFLIANPIAYTTTNKTVYARVENANGCYRVCTMTLVVSVTQIPSSFQIDDFVQCDDYVDVANDDKDGIATFNFSSATAEIANVLPTGGNYTIKYYKNETDFLAETDANGNSLEIPVATISNYRNSGYPNIQTIWARVDSTVANDCYGFTTFNLVVEALPIINVVGTNNIIRACDDDQDGIFSFNTSTLESDLLQGQNNVTVTYFDKNNNPLPSPFPSIFTTSSQSIRAIVTNNSTLACSEEVSIAFIVDDLPEAFSIPVNLTTVCDDEVDPLSQDGQYSFDTTTFQNSILGGQTGMKVNYFDKDGNPLTSPLPNPFVTLTQNITVEVENTINPTCKAILTIPFIVNPLPPIQLNTNGTDNELVCSNLPTFFVQLNAGLPNGTNTADYTYTWYKDSNIITNETGPTLDVNTEGDYSVEVATLLGCERTRTIKVTASDIATIASVDIVDLADNNTVTVDANGKGDYEYSLDLPNGPFQDSNFFDNVPSGIHEVYINDKNGCGTVSKTIAVTGAPKFFTPNGDNINDYWNIKGVNNVFNRNSIIYIFNRFGKLIKQITASSQGWDGTFTGQPMPADDYWFTVKLDDGREMKGHFSLKR